MSGGGPRSTGFVYNEQISGDVANQRATHLGEYETQDLPLVNAAFRVGAEGAKLATDVAVALATGGAGTAVSGAAKAGAGAAGSTAATSAAGATGAGRLASLGNKVKGSAQSAWTKFGQNPVTQQYAAYNPRVRAMKDMMARRAATKAGATEQDEKPNPDGPNWGGVGREYPGRCRDRANDDLGWIHGYGRICVEGN